MGEPLLIWSLTVDGQCDDDASGGNPTRLIEGVAKFDEHVQRHEQTEDVLAAGVVNERFDGDQRTARRQGVVGWADEMYLLIATEWIPVSSSAPSAAR